MQFAAKIMITELFMFTPGSIFNLTLLNMLLLSLFATIKIVLLYWQIIFINSLTLSIPRRVPGEGLYNTEREALSFRILIENI